MVPMRDGVSLATDVYLPARDGQAAGAALAHDPDAHALRQARRTRPTANSLPRHGYAFVVQDTRGRYASRGRLAHAHRRRPRRLRHLRNGSAGKAWSNGKLGTIGTSYVGGTQHALAMERPPQLVTVDPGRRDVEPRLSEHAQWRRVRAAVLELDLFSIAGPHGSRQARDPATAAVLLEMKNRPPRLPAEPAAAARHDAAETLARVRRVAGRGHGARRERRLLEAEQHPRPRRAV